MDNLLPTDFDLIVVGTGIVESIVSAAASRIGKTVLNVDNNNYYGGMWSSFNLDAIQTLGDKRDCNNVTTSALLVNENEVLQKLVRNNSYDIRNFSYKWHIPEKIEEVKEHIDNNIAEEHSSWNQTDILKQSRKFNLDLSPKLQYARGELIELLISSNVARYSEYRNVSRVLTWLNDQLEIVPCSRSDVFANSKVSVIEKRMLMKLLTSLDDNSEEINNYSNKTFRTYLKDKKLTPNLLHYVLYAISMSTDQTSCQEGVDNTKRFLSSLGRFGKTPFLFSMYGSGEISQAFCRLSAVFGGICALNQNLNSIITENNKFKAICCGNQRIDAKHLVIGIEKTGDKLIEDEPTKFISRAIFLTDRSVMVSEKEHLTLLLYPIHNGNGLCTIIEMGTLTGTCPKDMYVIHMVTKSINCNNPEDDFQDCVTNLFQIETGDGDNKPKILWSCYFTVPDSNEIDLQPKSVPENIFVCPGPDAELDFDVAIIKAKEIFKNIYPGEEFLPRAPDPEDIVYEGEDGDDCKKEENHVNLMDDGAGETNEEENEQSS